MAFYLSGSGLSLDDDVMDDYAEFAWAPGFRTGSYVHWSTSYSSQGVKISRFVHVTLNGTSTANGTAGPDTFYLAAGLPYSAVNTSPTTMVGFGDGSGGFNRMTNQHTNAIGGQVAVHSNGQAKVWMAHLTYYHA
jgi:hypothetical protein